MNKLVAVLVIAVILLSFICGILFYQISDLQSQNSDLPDQICQLENQVSELETQLGDLEQQNIELQNQTSALEECLNKASNANLVTITGMKWYYSLMLYYPIDITVQNFGTSDVDGLKLIITTDSGDDQFREIPVGLLKAGETKVINEQFVHTFYQGSDFVFATLMIDELILDIHSVQRN